MANYWMHNGFLQVEGEKMSKSLGNFVTINELLRTDNFGQRSWHGGVLRLAMLKTHYRQPLDFTVEQLRRARDEMEVFHNAVTSFSAIDRLDAYKSSVVAPTPDGEFLAALADDLNTPLAISRLHELCRSISDDETALQAAASIETLGLMDSKNYATYSGIGPISDISVGARLFDRDLFGATERLRVALANDDRGNIHRWISTIESWGVTVEIGRGLSVRLVDRDKTASSTYEARIKELIASRASARARKDWKESDRIRDELAAMGVVLKDSKDGTTWEIAR